MNSTQQTNDKIEQIYNKSEQINAWSKNLSQEISELTKKVKSLIPRIMALGDILFCCAENELIPFYMTCGENNIRFGMTDDKEEVWYYTDSVTLQLQKNHNLPVLNGKYKIGIFTSSSYLHIYKNKIDVPPLYSRKEILSVALNVYDDLEKTAIKDIDKVILQEEERLAIANRTLTSPTAKDRTSRMRVIKKARLKESTAEEAELTSQIRALKPRMKMLRDAIKAMYNNKRVGLYYDKFGCGYKIKISSKICPFISHIAISCDPEKSHSLSRHKQALYFTFFDNNISSHHLEIADNNINISNGRICRFKYGKRTQLRLFLEQYDNLESYIYDKIDDILKETQVSPINN